MTKTKKCFKCKQNFLKEELIEYSTLSGKTSYWFCKNCYQDKINRDNFSNKVCEIFGINNPGPVIWTQRKRIQEKYGYTDNVIIDTLEYLYYVKKENKYSESLYLVTPTNVQKMIEWKTSQEYLERKVKGQHVKEPEEIFVTVRKKEKPKVKLNADDYL